MRNNKKKEHKIRIKIYFRITKFLMESRKNRANLVQYQKNKIIKHKKRRINRVLSKLIIVSWKLKIFRK